MKPSNRGSRKRADNNRSRSSQSEKSKNPDIIEVYGEVKENLPNTLFRVTLDEKFQSKELICYLSGKMRKHYIKILPGDKVKIEVSKYDLGRGRIVYRLK